MVSLWRSIIASALCAVAVATPVLEKRVAVGQIITSCTVPGTVAIAFDDGPFQYTSQALDILDRAGMKGTFFVNGQNYDNINNNAAVVQRMVNSGHQVGSHTWSHADLSTLNAAGITSQMTQLEQTLLNIIGKYPTYMRPPYFGTNSLVLSTLGGLGYKVIQSNIDTKDYENQSPTAIRTSINTVNSGLASGGNLLLMHDPLVYTVQNLLPAVISALQSRGLRGVTVGTCLGESAAGWYATGRSGSTNPPPTTNPPSTGGSGTVSTNGQCGASQGRCPSGQCCSQYGWCGTTAEYCSAGCQSAFGGCSGGSTTTPPATGGGTKIDPSGKCGGSTGFGCAAGQCCSQYGYCGTGSQYCG